MFLIFDIGATNTRLAVGDKTKLLKTIRFPTADNFDDGIDNIVVAAKKLSKNKKIQAVVGGVPGPLNRQKTTMIAAPNLPKWNNRPLANVLQRKLKIPIHIENDADLASLGEAVFGAGKKHRIVAYLTISTGVGGGLVINKKIAPNSHGFEPGHQVICEQSLENLISGTAVAKNYGKLPEKINNNRLWIKLARYLAIGLYNTTVHWSPDIIILGGSMILGKPAISLQETTIQFQKINRILPELPPFKKAKLGDKAGLYGGLALLRN